MHVQPTPRSVGAAEVGLGQVSPKTFDAVRQAMLRARRWIGSGVANHVDRACSESGLRLVLRALQTPRKLFGAACRRDPLCLRATDGEWSDIRSKRVYGGAPYAAVPIAGNGDESSEREISYCGDQ
jgi:hypothetical protein